MRVFLLSILGLLASRSALAGVPDHAQARLSTETLVIKGADHARHVFTVELATTPEQQEIGEMFRPLVPADQGMLFDWGSPRSLQMWMENTLVPLDMIFIGQDGKIAAIVENAVPGSLKTIGAPMPARATLELQGGITAKLNISVGDRVIGAPFDPPVAAER